MSQETKKSCVMVKVSDPSRENLPAICGEHVTSLYERLLRRTATGDCQWAAEDDSIVVNLPGLRLLKFTNAALEPEGVPTTGGFFETTADLEAKWQRLRDRAPDFFAVARNRVCDWRLVKIRKRAAVPNAYGTVMIDFQLTFAPLSAGLREREHERTPHFVCDFCAYDIVISEELASCFSHATSYWSVDALARLQLASLTLSTSSLSRTSSISSISPMCVVNVTSYDASFVPSREWTQTSEKNFTLASIQHLCASDQALPLDQKFAVTLHNVDGSQRISLVLFGDDELELLGRIPTLDSLRSQESIPTAPPSASESESKS